MLYEDVLIELGLRVKYFRIRKKLSQAQLAELIGVDEYRISNIECGKCNMTLKTLNKISIALGADLHKLFCFKD